ncbi:hypothetical protein [Mycobacterium sp.]|jgi:hypothetical protein|uniref:hypothetical protein n=1 Tax=Mycobacterium sp. TaxID=1785 RepID=UPI002D246A19|nr:hypothetical protein [Mycobacterium sp.]HZA09241.1 hypothetical protein [Mycobacterium sp.]
MTESNRGGRVRSSPAVRLLVGALMVSLVLGGALVLTHALRSPSDTINHPAHPLTDDQARAQVVESARQIVAITQLRRASGGYTFLSCKNESDPPYQGAANMTFELPGDAVGYFQRIADTLAARGWSEGLPPNQYAFGKTLSKDGVTAIFYRSSDYLNVGIVKLYGECRNMSNHRNDDPAWTDITLQAP